MLIYNLKRLFSLRGIKNPMNFLMNSGFTRSIAYRLQSDDIKSIDKKVLEKLCITLQCTPSDLMEWKPDKTEDDNPKHILFSLKRAESRFDISTLIRDVPIDKVESLMDEIKKNIERVKKGN